ncbi:molybdopterin-guanine dinucleotide biosynthesis protein B [Halosolutus amylolyticus]|uniref:Molybdopterin-guanine dinucleotide biosynthesis protein B n=1 Tax=Halosolutus amylolyticus TaxID=2932267 RepID=A0ABD5PWM8_9EURY|nr:molybdopterin-guanine dinucleotide biosynthesis protein B [Halosolutus amylolyticus]
MTHRSSLRVVCLAGPSDSGKTTLVEELVPRLAADDRVATVKSIHHDVEIDTPGTDTYRHRTAGAETVVGITPGSTFEVSTRGKRDPPATPDGTGVFESDGPELQALASTLERLAHRGYDVVLVEGFTTAPLPTIVVGDRDPSEIGGAVVGRGTDDLVTLIRTIRNLDPIDPSSDRSG